MKKIIAVLVVIFVLFCSLFAQNGYRVNSKAIKASGGVSVRC